MAGLDPAIHEGQSAVGRRGWPCRARPWRDLVGFV